jgi:hypothetical protein
VGQRFRCPACQATVGAGAPPAAPAERPAAPATCPICQTALAPDDETTACPRCDQVHHRACWDEIGGCSTYGCPAAPAAAKDGEAEPPLAAWGDTKRCPACGERIKSIALRCRYCGTDFDTVDPLTAGDLHRVSRRDAERGSLRVGVVVLFVLTLTGCLAPVTLLVGLAYFLPRRAQLARAGPAIRVLAYATLGLAGLYSVLMAVFAAAGGLP